MANPNPSPETRFGGARGNASGAGKSKGQRKAEIKAAEIAATLRKKALSELLEKVKAGEIKASDLIEPATLKLFKDSEDRAHGTPKQSVDHSSEDGSMSPKAALDMSKLSDEALKEIVETFGTQPDA